MMFGGNSGVQQVGRSGFSGLCVMFARRTRQRNKETLFAGLYVGTFLDCGIILSAKQTVARLCKLTGILLTAAARHASPAIFLFSSS